MGQMGILPEITTTWTRNPPEECESAGNYQLVDKESIQGKGIPPGITSLFKRIQAGKIKMRG
jgi:hypothetical protein